MGILMCKWSFVLMMFDKKLNVTKLHFFTFPDFLGILNGCKSVAAKMF